MKKCILFFSFILLSGTLTLAQTVDEIVEKHLDAMGGKDKLKSLTSVVMEGKVSAQGMEIPMHTTIVNKKGFRLDFSLMGMDAWIIMRPDSGWSFMPFQGQTKPEAIPEDQLKEGVDKLDLSSELCDYKEKGHNVEYLGMDDVEGTECHKLKCVTKNGKLTYYLLDPDNFYIVKTISKEKAGGREFNAETKFSNYKKIDGGYIFPHTIESMNGPVEMVKITVNKSIPDSKFTLGK
jgi:hypothetical protein